MSLIYYKLKNAIQQNSVTFDGSVIQIGDVKRLVAEKQGLGSEGYQEITLYDPNTGDEYDNDSKVVPRNTLVEVKRKPAATFAPLTAKQQVGEAKALEIHTISAAVATTAERDGEEECGKALETLAKGTASTWQKEVRQGVLRGRGRGRGAVPAEYRCPRCEAFGAHWIQDCPTHGDPTYDKKRVRPPVGIPMTRLARSTEGGLVLPDGNTGTLIANEDAFAREVLGIGSVDTTQQIGAEDVAANGTKQSEQEIGEAKQQTMGFMPFSISAMSTSAPRLAGMNLRINSEEKTVDKKDGDLFELLKYPELPRGPRDFLLKAYNRDTPLSLKEFEDEQELYINTNSKKSKSNKPNSGYGSRSRSPSRRHVSKRQGRSRSRSRETNRRTADRRRRRSNSRERIRKPRHVESRKDSRRPDDGAVLSKQKIDVNSSQITKSEKPERDDSEKNPAQRKHSPIRWSKPISPRKGANFAGQDEEPDLDYGESDDNAPEERSRAEEKEKRSSKGAKDRKDRPERSGDPRNRESKSRREKDGHRHSNKGQRRRR